ncbi:MAG: GNAT family N-acetyltransferase [Cytophagales bacterium]|nr:GNAT family N-acetyltransferase [Cytophagales bacterium]
MKYLNEFLNESVVSVEDLIDIIDMDHNNPRYDKYKKILKDEHDIDYVEPKIRYKQENKLIDKYTTHFKAKTKKGETLSVNVHKTSNLEKSLSIEVFDENGNPVGRAGFEIDTINKTIRIGGAIVEPNMRRKGVYSVIVDFIQKIAKENKLKILDIGRSDDAKAFWKNR